MADTETETTAAQGGSPSRDRHAVGAEKHKETILKAVPKTGITVTELASKTKKHRRLVALALKKLEEEGKVTSKTGEPNKGRPPIIWSRA